MLSQSIFESLRILTETSKRSTAAGAEEALENKSIAVAVSGP